MKTKPDLSFNQLWNISFGFFGVQIAYALQSANISRIFATLGADPHNLSYFWILPPLMGYSVMNTLGNLLSLRCMNVMDASVQFPLLSATVTVLTALFGALFFREKLRIPTWVSLGLTVASAMTFGLIALMFLDTSINMAMQPFKMMVGDMVNEKQKAKAYSIQSFLCNAGSLAGYVFPFLFAAIGIANTAPEGEIPASVKWSFYVGAAILILCVLYTTAKVKEYTPAQMAEFQAAAIAGDEKSDESTAESNKAHAWKVFFEVGLVQFFCWAAFMYMWTYTNGTIADTVWHTADTASEGYQTAGNWVGILFAVQAIGSVIWAVVLPQFKNIKVAYALSLVIGGIGFVMVPYCTNQYLLFVPYFLIGFAWAAMLAMPFTLVTNALEGSKYMGTMLGLFNCTICIPQIVAAALGGVLLSAFGSVQGNMLILAGILLVVGAACVFIIQEKKK